MVSIHHLLMQATRLHERRDLPTWAEPAMSCSERASRRLQKWQSIPPFAQSPERFAQRLAQDGLSSDRLCALLELPDQGERVSLPPAAWQHDLQMLIDEAARPSGMLVLPEVSPGQPLNHLGLALAPALRLAQRWLAERLDPKASCPVDLTTLSQIVMPHIDSNLLNLCLRTFILELHIANLETTLSGATTEERFHSFCHQLSDPERFISILQTYPVLGRDIVTVLRQQVDCIVEMAVRLAADWPDICSTLAPSGEPDALIDVHMGAGDVHRQGRSVMILRFSSGWQMVYKPRPLAVDQHFQELLHWLNERGATPAFRLLRVLDCGAYGWEEYVAFHPCQRQEEVWRFYERQGAYLAVLYALGATDLHQENLLACSEHPMLLDLECLFHPDLAEIPAGTPALQFLRHSVVRSGLLPQRIWGQGDQQGIDISGLGGMSGQMTPWPVATLKDSGTDQMRLVREHVALEGRSNRPIFGDQPVTLSDYLPALLDGFQTMYRLLVGEREALLVEVLPRFAQDPIRVIIRPTQTYARLLQESHHPTALRDGLDRDRLLDHLWGPTATFPHLSRFIPAEQTDLWEQTIPCFTTLPASCDLWDSHGNLIAAAYTEAAMTTIERKICALNEHDLACQVWVIQALCQASTMGDANANWKHSVLNPATRPRPSKLIQAASDIGDRLAEQAIWQDNAVDWLGIHLIQEHSWQVMPVGMDLYRGQAGIALFLGYLGAITHKKAYTTLAEAALRTLLDQVGAIQAQWTIIGGFDGWGGLLYATSHLATIWGDASWRLPCQRLVAGIAQHLDADRQMDVIGGAAGALLSLLAYHKLHRDGAALDLAVLCGEHLLAHVQPQTTGVAWATNVEARRPLVGFSHGVAGIALSLVRLARASGQERFAEVARQALAYEHQQYVSEHDNWPDWRVFIPDDQRHTMMTWCHGAPGIALGRLAMLAEGFDASADDLHIALAATRARGWGMNHSLCHGDLGNLEILLTASRVLHDPSLVKEVGRLAGGVLNSIRSSGWCSGISQGAEVPGLMTGLAGIGYGLLRLAAPHQVPSVLTLDAGEAHR